MTYTEPIDTRKNAQYHQHSRKCIKTVMRYHLTFVGKSIITKTINKCWEGCGEKETLVHSWRACKLGQPQWKIIWRFLKNIKTEQPSVQFSSVQSFSRVQLFVTPWTAACQASLSITNSQWTNSCPLSQRCHPTISSPVVPFSCPQSLPASESVPMSQHFA